MTSESETFLELSAEKPQGCIRRPFWGLASLILPLSGCSLVWHQIQHAYGTHTATWGLLIMAGIAVVVSCLAGLVCAIIAMARAERLLAFTIFGFIGNLTPLLGMLYYILEIR